MFGCDPWFLGTGFINTIRAELYADPAVIAFFGYRYAILPRALRKRLGIFFTSGSICVSVFVSIASTPSAQCGKDVFFQVLEEHGATHFSTQSLYLANPHSTEYLKKLVMPARH